jgi:serine/threonine protein kinase/TolB-like protein
VASEHHGDPSRPEGVVLREGSLFAGRYEIEALLGRGGMGSVYRAHDREVDELVALKTLDVTEDDPKALERFRREVSLARRVTHRNAARTYDLGEYGGRRFLTMEYVEGHTLRRWLARRPRPLAALDVALQIAAGLGAAHEAGVIHRDLKPGNIMVEAGGRVVITDFGIARMAEEQGRAQTGGLVGTPAYMAPEQVEGKALDARTDLYSLALILVEMLTGELPFSGDNPFALAMARLQVECPDLGASGAVPEPLLDPLERALCRNPDDRYPSATTFARALEQARAELGEDTESLTGFVLDEDALDESDWSADWMPGSQPTETMAPLAGTPQSVLQTEHDAPGPVQIPTRTTIDPTGLRLPVASTTGPRTGAKALAVLPFRYRGPAESEFIADALLDELTDVLSMTRGLKVSGSGATVRLTSAGDRDPRSLGVSLGVDVVVDGTIQLAGKRLRIAARLLEVEEGFQLWHERFEGQLEDVFELQDKLGKRIAEALRVELEIIGHRGLADLEAIESYLRARHAKVKWRLRGPEGAVAHYRAVLERAPAFTRAIAGLAIASMRAWFMPDDDGEVTVDWQREAKAAVEHAMAEAPDFPETRIAAASWAVQGGFYRQAAEHLREALRIAPTCALAHEYLGRLQTEAAHPERGIPHIELALELDPGLDWCLADLARYKALRGDYEGFEALMAKLAERTERHYASAQLMLMRVGAWQRDTAKIRAALEDIDPNARDSGTRTIRSYGPPLLEPYAPEALDAQHQTWLSLALENGRMRTLMHQLFAEQTAFHHDYERAIGHLQQAAQLVLVDLDWLDNCPLFEGLRDDPRFVELRAEVRARCEQIWSAG